MLVAQEDSFESKKLCLRCRGPCQDVLALSDYMFRVDDLRIGSVDDVHKVRLKFCQNSDLIRR